MQGFFAVVVQKHKATALHYDFGLQIGETMPSWSIPKGPTLDATMWRRAMAAPHVLDSGVRRGRDGALHVRYLTRLFCAPDCRPNT
ncbi:MAG: hypothetical protein KGI38_06125 [Thaumarchaeota archaeon]|nr:hypothetical protein [Nitrososphaerota archaeon]